MLTLCCRFLSGYDSHKRTTVRAAHDDQNARQRRLSGMDHHRFDAVGGRGELPVCVDSGHMEYTFG